MAKIFLSYSHKDSEIGRLFARKLKELNHEIVLNFAEHSMASNINLAINDALKEADGLIILFTENTLTSQWVIREISTAKAFYERSDSKFIIPVLIGDMEIPEIVNEYLAFQTTNNQLDDIIYRVSNAISSFMARVAVKENQKQETLKRIEASSTTFIDETLAVLTKKEENYRKYGIIWYIVGFVALLLGAAYVALTIKFVPLIPENMWLEYIYLGLRSLVFIALLIAASKYSFNLGKAYTNESLRNADRIHAISFGRFYLRAFGDRATWPEIKEVFQHWNIDKNSFFTNLDANQFDPKFIEALMEFSKVVKR